MPVPTPDQIESYATIAERVTAAIAGLTPAQMQATPIAGEWSVHQIIIHLADSEAVGYERIRRTIAEERPPLQPYDEAAWGNNLYYHQQDPRLALELLKLLCQASAALLRQLPTEVWERVGIHADNGEMSLQTIFQTYLHHGEAHLHQIERVKRNL